MGFIFISSVYRQSGVPSIYGFQTLTIFAGKCYRLLVQNLELRLPVIDSNKYHAKIANKAKVSEKTYRSALEMTSLPQSWTI